MERLQKALAAAGVASRRACEELITAGRVSVNGRVVSALGTSVSDDDLLAVDGRTIVRPARRTYLLLNKPTGCVTTSSDPQGRPTVLDLVRANVGAAATPGAETRLYPVGRLDADSEGLVLLTDDGELTFRLTHPSFALEKEYRVLVGGSPGPEALAALRRGVLLDGRPTAPAEVTVESQRRHDEAHRPAASGKALEHLPDQNAGETWLRFVIHEGRNRQIRRMCLAVGHPARRLIRIRVGALRLGALAPGRWRSLTAAEIDKLKELTGLAPLPATQAPAGTSREPIDDHDRRTGGSRQERAGRKAGRASALPVLRHRRALPGRGVAGTEARRQSE